MAGERRILFVCLGNICRSPMADALMRHKVAERGLEGFVVDSAGTGAWHEGNPPDPRTQEVLRAHGVPVVGRARQVVLGDADAFDVVLGMDRSNVSRIRKRFPTAAQGKVVLMLAPTTGGDVPDPYYGGDDGFEHVYQLLDEALDAWLDAWV